MAVTVVQGGVTSRKPGQELRSDALFAGEHQAQQHFPKCGKGLEIQSELMSRKSEFFPFSFYWIEVYA